MTEATLDAATLETAMLEIVAIMPGEQATITEYEPLTDANDEAVTDIDEEIVMVRSA